ncbi:putative bifunctional diguanylate cyclase/phosphodiesterase [Arvimicrobium flavum]|uniref:putative bifunctional diguanylate cyclase/phosphodiesterase n=1 Tax=Arvimicrobium flavum TaxID=3393320 RepID=UPI00237C094D|nr:EAL domain-containing protein [Mesorhizobium shangrilense]
MSRFRAKELPDDIYIPFVETLFRDGFTLAIGIFAQIALITLVWSKTGDLAYLAVVLCLVVIGVVRVLHMRKYNTSSVRLTLEEARKREKDYIIYGSMHGAILGVFGMVAIVIAEDSFAEIAAVCISLATATGIAGRNYGSPRMVNILIIALMSPLCLGFILRGDFYHVTLGLLTLPFLLAIHRYADTVRDVLFTAISAEKRATRLAQRFNRALNTMPHGLIMLGPDGRVLVANAEAAKLMMYKSADSLLGRSIHSLLLRGVAAGMLAKEDCRYIEAQLTRALREGRDRKVLVALNNGAYYEFSAREGSQDLGVITFEEVTKRVEAEEKIRTMARFDSLTGLANRAYFHEMVVEAMSGGDKDRKCGLVLLDLDDFKSVNDTLGHPVGDGLLYAVGERLTQVLDERTKIGRFGGDEFVLYFDRIENEQDLATRMDVLLAGLQGEIDVGGHALHIQASCGAVVTVAGEADFDSMIVKADLALYKAKEFGKNSWQLFETSLDEEFRSRQLMKAELRNAIETDGLRVVYQPIIDMDSMRIASCEALCRWDHPELGSISPSVFVPLAEEMGVISSISSFVLNSACAECAKWPNKISVSVNLSAKDFCNRDIVDRVRAALANSGLSPQRLELEVTETALLDDKALTAHYIEELKALGVCIALDDFGTGYSSLSYLHKLPLNKVKIDRSFVLDLSQNSRSLKLLKSVVSLSRTLGLSVTIEGVETFEQLKILAQHVKPDLVQGFLFGSALTAQGIETMSAIVWHFDKDVTSASAARRKK